MTIFDTFVEGGTVIFGFAVCAAFIVAGWRCRAAAAGRLLLLVYGVALILLVGWGVYWRSFPQFSQLGWI